MEVNKTTHSSNVNKFSAVIDGGTVDIVASEQKFRNILSQSPGFFCIVSGENMVIEFANSSILEYWEKTAEIIGKPLLEIFPELESQRFLHLMQDVYRSGKPCQAYDERVVFIRNGQNVEAFQNFVLQPVFENNAISGVSMMASDVTRQVVARKKVEAELQEAEKQKRLYDTITGSTPDLIYVFDLTYRFSYVNSALLKMWGSTWEKSIGKGLLENGYEPWHAEMHEREIDQVVATRKSVRGEVSFPHAVLGRRIYDYILVPVFDESGEVEAVAGTTRDITELKHSELAIRESEERFRNLADESPMFVFIIDVNSQASVIYWNKTWLTYTGQTMEEAKGRAWDGIVHPDDVSIVMEKYGPAFANREAYVISAVRVKRHDGEYRWHAFKSNPRFDTNGNFNGYVGVGFDIHEQKLTEEAIKLNEVLLQQKVNERTAQLQQTVEALQRSNQNLEDFAYAASHDLKEPIRKIHFFSDRVLSSLGERMSDHEKLSFERMMTAANRMSSLIDDLLYYSQVSIKPKSLENVNLNQLLQLVLNDLDLEIEQKNATVEFDTTHTVRGQHRQLQQVFHNLISNSLKYTNPSIAPRIRITSTQQHARDTGLALPADKTEILFCVIEVADNGIGFDQKDSERIFKVFTRLHGSNEYRGSGIGLSIVKKIVENHNGFILATGEPYHGARFKIYLPVQSE